MFRAPSPSAIKPPLAAAALIALLPWQPAAGNDTFKTEMVVAKVQLIYSVVGHYNWISDRVSFYNTKGVPAGNQNYWVPFLTCDPVVTLYNPTNSTLTESKLRIGIWDPPIGFKFKKNSTYLRPEFANPDGFLPMGRFQIANESNPDVRKSFTLLLREGQFGASAQSITLAPGESQTFSAYVEPNWTWGYETVSEWNPRSFYDWNSASDFTNKDPRTPNLFGVETRPGLDPRAGFQWDHLATTNRAAGTRYDFEITNNWSSGWVAIKANDTFSVEAKPMRAFQQNSIPDFRMGVMAGAVQSSAQDMIREFPMSLGNMTQRPAANRTVVMSDIGQTPSDKTLGGKMPFAMVTMVAKTKALRENRFYATPALPADSLYELRFDELVDYGSADRFTPASDRPLAGFEITKVERKGNQVFLDFQAAPDVFGLRVMGTSSLDGGFHENLNSRLISVPGPTSSGLHKLILDVSDKGPNYFIRVEDDES